MTVIGGGKNGQQVKGVRGKGVMESWRLENHLGTEFSLSLLSLKNGRNAMQCL